ncbi:MAG TPA: thiamine-phosphate kinase [Thermoanaerobaculia bacterium]|jgi:thiamine-monophosphate kinase|nr:thiamine-phosphate kinase [Thermoanaerobaculia bacterium]
MTRLRGEDALTAKIAAAARRGTPRGGRLPRGRIVRRVGIGDDAAVLDVPRGRYVATTDTLVEGIDFLRRELPRAVGRRAAAANLSDLAAMGADPEGYLLTIGLGPGRGAAYALAVARGVLAKMRPFGALLWGGDLSRAPATFVTICLVGRAERPVLRSGARPGDRIFVTGTPGAAAKALARRRSRKGKAPEAREKPYLDPEPRIAFARELARRRWASAMIDVSDGLGKDAHRLARSSGVRLALAGIPAETLASASDDFELLFTAPARRAEGIVALARRLGTPVAAIGRVEPGRGVVREAGARRRAVPERGYDHLA